MAATSGIEAYEAEARKRSRRPRKTSSPEELAAAKIAGLRNAHQKRADELNAALRKSMLMHDRGLDKWRNNVLSEGWPYYKKHRMPPGGWFEPGRSSTWVDGRTKPKAFIERYDPKYHSVFLVPKTRGPAKATGLMYSGTRIPKGHLTKHYKKIVVDKARVHANDRGMKVRGKDLDEKYKWARGYLKRNKLGIPRKSAENMGM